MIQKSILFIILFLFSNFDSILISDLGTKHIVYEQGGFEGITDLKNIHTYLFAKRKSFFEFDSRKVNEWRAK